MPEMLTLRQKFQQEVCRRAIFLKPGKTPSVADVGSILSMELSQAIFDQIGYPVSSQEVKGQTAGKNFEEATKNFLKEAMALLNHLRPGEWQYSVHGNIADFEQYQHLAELNELVKSNRELHTALGDYVVKPDVIVSRMPVSDEEINKKGTVVRPSGLPHLTPLRATNFESSVPILHASISCKLTLRSDRSQNARTEGLNLIRNRKGKTPHIVAVTAEPTPTRISSLALGTGDIDCVYHFALPELLKASEDINNEAVTELLTIMIDGKRLRDIADLPFDLAI